MSEYVLHIGMSKQHPNDRHVNKKLAIEVAVENALINPFAVINLETPNMNNFMFKNLVGAYYNTIDVKFVRTREEVANLKLEKMLNIYSEKECCGCCNM